MNDLQTALLYLIARGRMFSVEVAVALYLISSEESVTFKQITEYLGWRKQNTSRALLRLLSKNIIKLEGDRFLINEDWREWAGGVVAQVRPSVHCSKFSEKITENLILKLKKFALSRNLSQEDADDVVSATLLKAKNKFHQFHEGNFEGWMIQILKNTMRDFWKKKKESRMFDDELQSVESLEALEEIYELKNNVSHVKKCMEQLHPDEKDLLELWSMKEIIPYSEASIILGIPEGTVKSRMYRAKKHLKELLQKTTV